MQILTLASLSLIALIAPAALAQAPSQTFTIDPAEVTLTTKASWCQGEQNTCIELCDNNPKDNTCDPTTLAFTCNCQNGSAPGLQYYLQSMPTFICQQAYQDCIAKNTNSAQAQNNCTTNIKNQCGTLNAASVASGGSSSGTSAAQSSTSAAGGSSASSPPKTSGSASSSSSATPTASAVSTSTSKAAGAAPTNAYAAVGNGAAMAVAGMFAYLL